MLFCTTAAMTLQTGKQNWYDYKSGKKLKRETRKEKRLPKTGRRKHANQIFKKKQRVYLCLQEPKRFLLSANVSASAGHPKWLTGFYVRYLKVANKPLRYPYGSEQISFYTSIGGKSHQFI